MDETSETPRKPAEEILCAAWIVIGRVLELAAMAMSGWLVIRGAGQARLVGLVSLGLLMAYATPYVLGFSTERHFSLFILLCALCNFFLIDQFSAPGTRGDDRAACSAGPAQASQVDRAGGGPDPLV